SFDRKTGDLWIGDVGQDTWEEVDIVPHASVKPLLNFGWSVYEGNAKFKDASLHGGTLVKPAYVYHHGDAGCSITGGYVYRGTAGRAELLRCDLRELRRRIREGADPVRRREPAERRSRRRVRAEMERRALEREPLERGAPVPDAGLGPAIQLRRRGDAILGE